MSIRAFARWRRVSHTAVQRRIAAGALPTSAKKVKRRWVIVDAAKAVTEWEAHTRPRVAAAAANGGPAAVTTPSALAVATQRERDARAKLAELDYARKARDLVPARDVETRWATLVVAARTTLLGLPTRAKQRLPHLSSLDLVELDKLVREALEELATDDEREKGES